MQKNVFTYEMQNYVDCMGILNLNISFKIETIFIGTMPWYASINSLILLLEFESEHR